MAYINYYELTKYIDENNKIGSGKETNVYNYQDKVIKIFHENRKTSIPRISNEGLIQLTTLSLNCFNQPIDIIYKDKDIVGYTERFLEEKEVNFNLIDFDGIKKDIVTLSENGFCIEDLFYNYMFTEEGIRFIDLTSYRYLKTDNEFLKMRNLKKNMIVMNNFLIGLLHFNAFCKGASNEYTKIYLANEYRMQYCEDMFYGDLIQSKNIEPTNNDRRL